MSSDFRNHTYWLISGLILAIIIIILHKSGPYEGVRLEITRGEAEIIAVEFLKSHAFDVSDYSTEIYIDDERRKKILDDRINYTLDRIKKRLRSFSDKELEDYPKVEDRIESIQVCEGFPADVILAKANVLDCDAIVMGTHGKGIIANPFLGSVPKRVLRRARKPLFIIPLPKGEIDLTVHDD